MRLPVPIPLLFPVLIPLLGLLLTLSPSGAALALAPDEARHLLARTSFAATPGEIERLRNLDRGEAVARLVAGARETAVTAPPDWSRRWDFPGRLRDLAPEERKAVRERFRKMGLELKGWWYREMIDTPSPLTEVMTLFWHNHFTSGLRKVKHPTLMYRQNVLLRQHALGNFAAMLRAVARDPAMLIYLDGARNRARAPNENFARELLELFTLGEGHYGEADIKEAARAFTGWVVLPKQGVARFVPRRHDGGVKTLLGRRGSFESDHVIDILLHAPRTAEHIVEKLWVAFVSERPDPAEVQRLAALFRAGGYELRPLLRALLSSEAFWAPENRGRLIKSPVELIVGALRLFEIPIREPLPLVRLGRRLGQDLFQPPNVKGWPGGTTWISAHTLIERQALLTFLAGDAAAAMNGAPGGGNGRMARRARMTARKIEHWTEALSTDWRSSEALSLLLLPVDPVDTPVLDRSGSGALVRRLLVDPVYQLK